MHELQCASTVLYSTKIQSCFVNLGSISESIHATKHYSLDVNAHQARTNQKIVYKDNDKLKLAPMCSHCN